MAVDSKNSLKVKARDRATAGPGKALAPPSHANAKKRTLSKKPSVDISRSTQDVGEIEKRSGLSFEPEAGSGNAYNDAVFDVWDEHEFNPQDFEVRIPIDSLESRVGYSSLFRQMHDAFVRTVAFYRSPSGGSLSIDEARKAAFHACESKGEAKKIFDTLMSLPVESLNFVDLMELHGQAPRVAERFWERVKREARKEFESGHLAANISFPVGYMKGVWNIARYIGVRESFIADWQPKGGIEVSLIDMLTQAYFQWQYWLEETVKRSQTREREEHPDYSEWKTRRIKMNEKMGFVEGGYWLRPTVTEEQALDQAIQIADRWNRIFMRTLRQLRDLRRYSPVTINNPNQVNIASEGGKQVNIGNVDGPGTTSDFEPPVYPKSSAAQ